MRPDFYFDFGFYFSCISYVPESDQISSLDRRTRGYDFITISWNSLLDKFSNFEFS